MPGKQPVYTINASVHSVPSFQLYLQLYREKHAVLVKRAIGEGLQSHLAGCLVNEVLLWLYAQPTLLTNKETAEAYLITTLDELVKDVIHYQHNDTHAVSAVRPRYILFHVLAAKHPAHFEQAIQELPYPSSTIASLYYQGYSEKEIANRVNVSLGIVKRRLSFSLYLLKTQFAKKPKAPV